jgi:hypothetical protein
MPINKKIKDLTLDNILKEVNQETLFRFYCKNFKGIYKLFKSELREDNRPTCNVFVAGNNKLIYKDFNGITGDIIDYIKYKYNLSFIESLDLIVKDFNLKNIQSLPENKLKTTSKNFKKIKSLKNFDTSSSNTIKKNIKIKIHNSYRSEDVNYWTGKYNITIQTLKKFRVIPLEYYWINYNKFVCKNTLTYCFYFNNSAIDIYAPFSKFKWVGNTTYKDIYGYKQVLISKLKNDILFIASSLKEVMFLYELGYDAIAPQSENSKVPIDILKHIQKIREYKKIIILFDFDKPGIINSIKLFDYLSSEFENILERVKFCPIMVNLLGGTKDLTDLYEKNPEKSLEIIYNYKNYL